MISDEQLRELKSALERELVGIRMNAMAAFDAECICLSAELDNLWHNGNMESMGGDLRTLRKQITIDLDLHAVEVLSALRRVREEEYGLCVECGADLGYEDLSLNPAMRFCHHCLAKREAAKSN